MFNNKLKLILVILSLGLAFFASGFFARELFLGYSPHINPKFLSGIKNKVENGLAMFKKQDNAPEDTQIEQPVALQPSSAPIFHEILRGVEAAETPEGTIVNINPEEIEWIEYVFIVNGEEVKIKVPKGETPPNQEEVESIYQ